MTHMTQRGALMINIAIDVDRCTGCGVCSDFCPTSVLRMVEEENVENAEGRAH